MLILENYHEEVFDAGDGRGIGLPLLLSRSVILIAKVSLRNPLIEHNNFLKGPFGINLSKFVHVEVKHFVDFALIFLILEF
jgi:hypothetical protein